MLHRYLWLVHGVIHCAHAHGRGGGGDGGHGYGGHGYGRDCDLDYDYDDDGAPHVQRPSIMSKQVREL